MYMSIFSSTEVTLGKLDTLFIPWINNENEQSTFRFIKIQIATVAMGHLEDPPRI